MLLLKVKTFNKELINGEVRTRKKVRKFNRAKIGSKSRP